jgi:hypothetical protein
VHKIPEYICKTIILERLRWFLLLFLLLTLSYLSKLNVMSSEGFSPLENCSEREMLTIKSGVTAALDIMAVCHTFFEFELSGSGVADRC